MASFQADGKLFDGNGIHPDELVEPVPEYYIGGRDNVLEEAVRRIRRQRSEVRSQRSEIRNQRLGFASSLSLGRVECKNKLCKALSADEDVRAPSEHVLARSRSG
jgi:hypothetical protein